jgi:hypothetical protein
VAHDDHPALRTSLRRGELLGLRWEDVDLVRGKLYVQHSYVRGEIELSRATPEPRYCDAGQGEKSLLPLLLRRTSWADLGTGNRYQAAGDPAVATWREPTAGDDVVDVRMKPKVAGPGMKDGRHTELPPRRCSSLPSSTSVWATDENWRLKIQHGRTYTTRRPRCDGRSRKWVVRCALGAVTTERRRRRSSRRSGSPTGRCG